MKKKATSRKIGDASFPLEVNIPEDLVYDHKDVGKPCRVSPHATEELKKHRGVRGEVKSAILKNGQVVGYGADVEGKTFYAPKKDLWVDRKYLEDVHIGSAESHRIRKILAHWDKQRDYYGNKWDGLEVLHFELAKVCNFGGVESPGYYIYPSSRRSDLDGRDWRLIFPDCRLQNQATVVNCHSLIHDSVWTLTTTVFSTREIDLRKVPLHGHQWDHCRRSLEWTKAVADVLSVHGHDYSDVIAELDERIANAEILYRLRATLQPKIAKAYETVMNQEAVLPPLSMGFSKVRVRPISIGRHEPPTDECAYSIITIDPVALQRPKYLFEVVKHELIHYVLGCDGVEDKHGPEFQAIAELVDLPTKYRK